MIEEIDAFDSHLGISKRIENYNICRTHHFAECPCGGRNLKEAQELILYDYIKGKKYRTPKGVK